MSSKRMLGIAAFGAAFIALFIGVMLLMSYLRRDPGGLTLPETETLSTPGEESLNASRLKLVEITRDNVQDVIATLSRPDSYSREITIERFWDVRSAVHTVEAAVSGGVTSLKTSGGGVVKRVIVTPDKLYIWNEGDSKPLEREYGPSDNWRREADEWQMLLTYEDVLNLPDGAITDAGYSEYGGEQCIVVAYRSERLGYVMRFYISDELGLLVGAEEYDGATSESMLTYRMTSSGCAVGEPDPSAFLLPDGEYVHTFS